MAFTALLLLAIPAAAQFTQQVTWSSVSFIYHGEKTPDLLSRSPGLLTPLGATQMYDAGQLIRARYIDPPAAGSQLTTDAVINGISVNSIDNTQLYLLGLDDAHITTSAMAFMQGLYPPANMFEGAGQLQNGSFLSYPLGGYQYPNINAAGTLDFNYIWTAGNEECSQWSLAQTHQLGSTPFQEEYNKTWGFYQSLHQPVFGALDPTTVNFMNAMSLYEYALYEYTHNTTFQNTTFLSPGDLATLSALASVQQTAYLTPAHGNHSDSLPAIAARTLASKVLQQFEHNIASFGVADKMSLLFGNYEPFLSFFALSELNAGPSAGRFQVLPLQGSVMTFELFSYATPEATLNLSVPFPSTKDLWVRFLFRDGTNNTAPLISYPLFARGNSEVDMSWSDFVTGMAGFSINDVEDWCVACGSTNLFCEAIESNITPPSTHSGSSGLNPTISGVIGATVTIAVGLLVAAILMLCGFRVEFAPRREKKGEDTAENGAIGGLAAMRRGGGGFKGAEKLASDTDLRLKGNGAGVIKHERVGSWELAEGGRGESSLDKEVGGAGSQGVWRRSEDHGDFGLSLGGKPVEPREHV